MRFSDGHGIISHKTDVWVQHVPVMTSWRLEHLTNSHTSLSDTPRESYNNGDQEKGRGGCSAPPRPLHTLFIHTCSATKKASLRPCTDLISSTSSETEQSNTHTLMQQWCLLPSESCVCSADLKRCRHTFQSVPLCLACEAGEIHFPAEAGPGPVQLVPPTGWKCAWSYCHISWWLWARQSRWRSRWGRNSGDCADRCMGWRVHIPLPVLYVLKVSVHVLF